MQTLKKDDILNIHSGFAGCR